MAEGSGAPKVGASVDQKTAIKKAVDAFGKTGADTDLLSLLASADKATVTQVQELIRQRFGKEVWTEKDPQTQNLILKTKDWIAEKADKEALTAVGDKLFTKLLATPTAKVKLDSWLQKYNECISVGKLQWIKDYAKKDLGIDIVFCRGKEGILFASLKQGISSLPGIPKAPIPTALKREDQKTEAEKKQDAEKPFWDKAKDLALDKVASAVTELTALDNALGRPVQRILEFVKPQFDAFIGSDSPGVDKSKAGEETSANSLVGVNEEKPADEISADGKAVFRIDVTPKAEPPPKFAAIMPPRSPQAEPALIIEPPPELVKPLPALDLPKLPALSDVGSIKQIVASNSKPPVDPVPPTRISAALSFPPVVPEPSPFSVLDLPLPRNNEAVFDTFMTVAAQSVGSNSSTTSSFTPILVGAPFGPNTIPKAVELINFAVREREISAKDAEVYIAALRSGRVTLSEIRSFEDILRQMEASGVSVVRLQMAYSEVSAAKKRLEEQELARRKSGTLA